jgi:hypothetical protein
MYIDAHTDTHTHTHTHKFYEPNILLTQYLIYYYCR